MGKFKVGDKVRIKKNLKDFEFYGEDFYIREMDKYKGKIATVDKLYNKKYRLDIDNHEWCWTDEMLEPAERKIHFKSLPRNFTGTIKIENGFITEIIKEKKEILDKAEKEYLSAVIKPFKKEVTFIRLEEMSIYNRVYIYIGLNDYRSIMLPLFERGKMYKNMKVNKEYTLKELGLFSKERKKNE